ncbi:MAG: hypothetical protein JXR18_13365 [Neptuniibacter sp.]
MLISRGRFFTALLTLLVSTNLYAPPGGGSSPITLSCNTDSPDPANINELVPQGTHPGGIKFIEVKVLEDVADITGWQLCTSDKGKSPDCFSFGSGDFILGDHDDGNNDSGVTSVTAPQYFSNEQTLSSNEWEIALLDSSGDVLDYVHYCNSGCTPAYWDVPASCATGFDGTKDNWGRNPDGTGDFEKDIEPTPGTSNNPPVGSSVDHYSISHSGSGISCLAEDVTISAHDSSHSVVDAEDASITVNASNNVGNWTLKTGSGSFSNGTSDDGEATYTFAASETSVVLSYSYTGTGTFGFNVTDGSITESSGSAIAADDPSITFDTTEFRFIDSSDNEVIPTQIAGKASNVAPNSETLYLQAITTSDDNPADCDPLFTDGTAVDIDFAAQCDDPSTCAGQTFSFTGNETTNIATNAATPATPASYTTVEMLFGVDAKALFSFTYNDAGQMQLHASYTAVDTGAVLTGASSQFVVRPFAFGFPSVTAGALSNPAGDEATGDGFVSAGSSFNASVNAYLYSDADDTNSDGIPDAIDNDSDGVLDIVADVTDNGVTPNFEGTATLSADATYFTPLVGNAGALGPAGGLDVSLAIGTSPALSGDLSYSEVGSFYLRAGLSNYMGEVIPSEFKKVGRIFPDHFVLVSNDLIAACDSGTHFTYMQQPFETFSYYVEARSADDQVTTRYDIGWYTGTASIMLQAENADDGTDLSARVDIDTAIDTISGWQLGVIDRTNPTQGTASSAISTLTFSRQGDETGLEDGPFNLLQLGLKVDSELDSRDFSDSDKDMKADSAGACGAACDAVQVGNTQIVRYGRLYIQSAHGPENALLPVPFSVQYWNGSSFVTSTDDSCSALPLTDITFDGNSIDTVANRTVAIGGGNTTGSFGISGANAQPTSGSYNLEFSAPGAGNTGYFNIGISNVPNWLRYDWDQNGSADDSSMPDALITFGRARGNDRMIFWQERYQ